MSEVPETIKRKKRDELRSYFKNERYLSEIHFRNLIDSTLNCKDDQFYGKWNKGQHYYPGDVVIHNNRFWSALQEICIDNQDDLNQKEPGQISSEYWKPLAGEHWTISDDQVMYTHGVKEVGISLGGDEEGNQPEGKLDIQISEGKPILRLSSLDSNSNPEASFAIEVDQTRTSLITDAQNGFAFYIHQDIDDENIPKMGIYPSEHETGLKFATLGLNQATPRGLLDITDKHKGRFCVLPIDHNQPILRLSTLPLEGLPEKSLELEINQTFSSWNTDTEKGFVFNYGQENEPLMSIGQSQDNERQYPQVAIGTHHGYGRLGVGKFPDNYELDVLGMTCALAHYQVADKRLSQDPTPLTSTLKNIMALKPISFQWSQDSRIDWKNPQFGLYADDVQQIFPQVVRVSEGETPGAIAYQNLVPVLIKAIQELNERNEQLANRIALLAIGLAVGWAIALLGVWT